jgi:hypothetical protein
MKYCPDPLNPDFTGQRFLCFWPEAFKKLSRNFQEAFKKLSRSFHFSLISVFTL